MVDESFSSFPFKCSLIPCVVNQLRAKTNYNRHLPEATNHAYMLGNIVCLFNSIGNLLFPFLLALPCASFVSWMNCRERVNEECITEQELSLFFAMTWIGKICRTEQELLLLIQNRKGSLHSRPFYHRIRVFFFFFCNQATVYSVAIKGNSQYVILWSQALLHTTSSDCLCPTNPPTATAQRLEGSHFFFFCVDSEGELWMLQQQQQFLTSP